MKETEQRWETWSLYRRRYHLVKVPLIEDDGLLMINESEASGGHKLSKALQLAKREHSHLLYWVPRHDDKCLTYFISFHLYNNPESGEMSLILQIWKLKFREREACEAHTARYLFSTRYVGRSLC